MALTPKKIILTAREFRERKLWIVDNSNCLSALFALRFQQPSELYLVARDGAEEEMPIEVVEEMSRITKDCTISMRFVDSFLMPGNTATDQERLKCIMKEESFTIHRFYGYLAKEDIVKLQSKSDSITSLGLAIKNQTDAATISSLQGWHKLAHFNVSVRIDIDVHDLMPLNQSFLHKEISLTFPFLTDKWVDNVSAVIEVLMRGLSPNKKIFGLYFPKSRLTAAGAWRLSIRLKSLGARGVCIELCGSWKPDQKEKDDLTDIYKSICGITEFVKWDVDWLYTNSIMQPKQQKLPKSTSVYEVAPVDKEHSLM